MDQSEQRERSIELGKALIEKELSKHDLSFSKMMKAGDLLLVAKEFSFETVDDLFAGVGYGPIHPSTCWVSIYLKLKNQPNFKRSSALYGKEKTSIRIEGVDGVVVRFAKCCNPIPGDKILGFITRGRGLTVHTSDCPNILTYDDQRKVPVSWELNKQYAYPVRIKVLGMIKRGFYRR